MSTTHSSVRLTTIDRWLAPHAAALLSFAHSDTGFAVELVSVVEAEHWSIVDEPTITASQYLRPSNHADAEDILDWLLYELVTHPEARVTRSLLKRWSQSYEAPQDLIWGLTLTDSFGPTLTGQPKKSKSAAKLQIVSDKCWQASLNPTEFHEITHALSQQVVAIELRKAGGKISSLHPDTAEWCMGGAGTKLYESTTDAITLLHQTATKETLNHQIVTRNDQVVAIAISPSVNDKLVEETA